MSIRLPVVQPASRAVGKIKLIVDCRISKIPVRCRSAFLSVFLDKISNLLDALQDRSSLKTCVLSRTVKIYIHNAL